MILWRGEAATRWNPRDDVQVRASTPEAGALIAFDHAVWRVVRVVDWPEVDWPEPYRQYVTQQAAHGRTVTPVHVTLRPPWRHDHPDPVVQRREDRSVTALPGRTIWHVVTSEHYAVCVRCQEPMPCRHRHAKHVAAQHMARLARYEIAGSCPACREPITDRQQSITFTENLELPGGPPVTFHLRGRCRGEAEQYEQRWVDADPNRRRTRLTCPGHLTNHNDGTYDCSALNECRGPAAQHASYSVCACPDCHARGAFSCRPGPHAHRNGS